MIVHIVDGTYELFRQFFARPSHLNNAGEEVSAVRAVLRGTLIMLEEGATHIGVATDHVVESFRNKLYESYKSGEGIDPTIKSQFLPLEEGLQALGVAVYPMIDHEADDAMASLAAVATADTNVEKVLLCTPDKDLAQCVQKGRVLQFDRRNNKILDVDDVVAKYGVPPASIADWLALTGDSADGFPGLKGWGAKSSAAVLARYTHIEQIPPAPGQWDITVRGSTKLAQTLVDNMDDALLFKKLATLVTDAPVAQTTEELRWQGPTEQLAAFADHIDAPDLVKRAEKLIGSR